MEPLVEAFSDKGVTMTEGISHDTQGPIAQVREGMKVVDADGDEVGKVASVRMGDPEAVTAQGEEPPGEGGIIGAVATAVTGGESLPEQAREELERLGYVRIDRHKLVGRHLYASSSQVARVADDVVHLGVREAELVR